MTARTAAQRHTTSNLDRLVTEADLQATIVEIAVRFGWSTHHQFDSRRSNTGWPDLVLLRPPRALFVELKTEIGKVSAGQAHVLERLQACGFEVAIWRPSMLDDVIATLREPAT